MRLGRSFRVSLRGLLALVGLASGFAVLSGCTNGAFIYTVPPQNTLAKPNARDQGGVPQSWVDWTKSARDQTGDTYPLYEGIGTP
jgi:hypothetical protein